MKKSLLLVMLACLLLVPAYARNLGPGSLQQGDMFEWVTAVKNSLLNTALNPAGLGIGTNTANVGTAVSMNYTVDGIFYQFPASANITPAKFINCGKQPVNTYKKYLYCISAPTTSNYTPLTYKITVVGGDPSKWNNAKLPIPVSHNACIGYVKVKSPSDNFVFGTWNLAGFFNGVATPTVVYKNVRALESGTYGVGATNEAFITDDVSDGWYLKF